MNKSEFIDAVASKSGLSKADATKAVAAIFDIEGGVIADTIANGEKVVVTGFGTFTLKERAARQGVNPATKAKITIPASKAVKFTAGVALKGRFGA
jgi:DNA-binding protein HU-beta